jgi:hypothetical protein
LILTLELVQVEVVVSKSIFVVSVTAVHLESNAFVNEHFVLALAWQLEAFVGEHNVLPDLRNFDLFHLEEFFGIVVLIPLKSVEFTELESEQEELVRILNKIVENIYDFESHLLDLDALRLGFVVLAIKLINLVLGLNQSLQELWDLSTLESVVHLRELIELEFLQLIEIFVALSRLNDLDVSQNKVVEKSKLLLNIWHKLIH